MIFEPIIVPNALSSFLADYALSSANHLEPQFQAATVSTGDTEFRKARVCYNFSGLQTMFQGELSDFLRTHKLLPGGAHFETQLTASGDGDYFKLHNDNGSPDSATRVVTYVWYFHKDPKPFRGGEIRLYDMESHNGHWHACETYRDIEVLHNLLVVFPSYQLHEVLPVVEP